MMFPTSSPMRRGCFAATVCASALISVSGCSPYVYEKEIAAFGTATGELTGAVRDARADLQAQPRIDAFWGLYDNPKKASFDEKSCRDADANCHLFIDGNPVKGLTELEAEVDMALSKLEKLDDYAAALKSVTDAKDRTAFKAASGELATTVGGLIGLAPGGGAAAGVASAALKVVSELALLDFDQARLNRLREAVAAVDPHLRGASEEIVKGLNEVVEIRLLSRWERGDRATEALRVAHGGAERARLSGEILDRYAEIRAIQASDMAKLTEALVDAHSALNDALSSPQSDPVPVAEAIASFASSVKTLADAFRSL